MSWRELNLPRKQRSAWDSRGAHEPVAKGSNVWRRKTDRPDNWQSLGDVTARVRARVAADRAEIQKRTDAQRAEMRDRMRAERARAFPGTTPEAIAAWWKRRGF